MKKITFFLAILLATSAISCSKDDNNNETNNFINPPDWIIGTWQDETLPEIGQIGGFTFTTDNLITITSSGETINNLKEGLQEGVDAGVITTNEVITDSNYELEIATSGTITNSFKFTRGSDATSIIYDLSVTFDVVLTKQ